MPKYRVTLVVEMDVEASNAEDAFEYVHHEATRNADFICVEAFDPELVRSDAEAEKVLNEPY